MGDHGRWWPWLVGAAGLAGLTALVVVAVRTGGETAVTSLSVLLSATVGVLGWSRHRSRPARPASVDELDRAAGALSAMVRRQWTEEVAAQGLLDPSPLAVRWRSAQTEAGDHVRIVGRVLTGRTDDIAGFTAGFRALPHRRLVILGEPGSGKTTLAMLLVRELVEHPEPGQPVPVLLDLSSWNPRHEPLTGWMARRIHEDYPALRNHEEYGRYAARRLVAEARVLPVLDGLDELPEALRPEALTAVNHAIAVHGPLVLTSRAAEFDQAVGAADVVTGAAVVMARPVAADDVSDYLRDTVAPRRMSAWQLVIDELERDPQGTLATTFSLPLNVWLARTVYAAPGTDPGRLARFTDPTALQHHLLDALVPAVFNGTRTPLDPSVPDARRAAAARWHPEEAHNTLRFLAAHLERHDTDDIAWWQLHRTLPHDPAGPLSAPLAGAVLGLGAGCMAGDWFNFVLGPFARLVGFLVITIATGVAGAVAIRQAYVGGGGVRGNGEGFWGGLRRVGILCAVIAPLAVCVGAFIEHWTDTAAPVFDRPDHATGMAPMTGLRMGLLWAAFMGLFTLGVLLVSVLRRALHGHAVIPHRRHRGSVGLARLRKVLTFGFLFWLGTELAGALAYLSIRQVPDQPVLGLEFVDLSGDLSFANQRASFRALLFLLIIGVLTGLGLSGGSSRPTYLDFRLRGRGALLLSQFPHTLGRGLLFGSALGLVLAYLSPWDGHVPVWERIASAVALGAYFGILFGIGLAIVRWARTSADLDQATPLSTLNGDRKVAATVVVLALVPPMLKWWVVYLADLTHSMQAVHAIGDWLASPEACFAIGLAAGVLVASDTAYFMYRETCMRLAATRRLPHSPVSFLEDARLLNVVRRVGSVYQFCHARLKDRMVLTEAVTGETG
ncbi:NACHT domain-containing protein [Streptomyces sp. NPDC050619]|uniref:NACHT domain-containing protein n=1 Tax=Streptomyces sp. NPDC050619 TaxID=3157214 RepID=UPI003421F179